MIQIRPKFSRKLPVVSISIDISGKIDKSIEIGIDKLVQKIIENW